MRPAHGRRRRDRGFSARRPGGHQRPSDASSRPILATRPRRRIEPGSPGRNQRRARRQRSRIARGRAADGIGSRAASPSGPRVERFADGAMKNTSHLVARSGQSASDDGGSAARYRTPRSARDRVDQKISAGIGAQFRIGEGATREEHAGMEFARRGSVRPPSMRCVSSDADLKSRARKRNGRGKPFRARANNRGVEPFHLPAHPRSARTQPVSCRSREFACG